MNDSPNFTARAAGFFWLMCIVTGVVTLVLRSRVIVQGDGAATAANIAAHEGLFRAGTTMQILSTCAYIGVTLFIYELLKPVNQKVSLLAAFFSLVGCGVGALNAVFDQAALIVMQMPAFNRAQLEALLEMLIEWNWRAGSVGFAFFGFHCLLIGCLILKSTFLPRIVGALMVLAGLGWLTFLVPTLASALLPYPMMLGILGEATLTFWLLLKGVNVAGLPPSAMQPSTVQ